MNAGDGVMAVAAEEYVAVVLFQETQKSRRMAGKSLPPALKATHEGWTYPLRGLRLLTGNALQDVGSADATSSTRRWFDSRGSGASQSFPPSP